MRSRASLFRYGPLGLLVLLMLASGGLAALLPEDLLWASAFRALMLSAPRVLAVGFVVWGLWEFWRHRSRAGVLVFLLGLLASGIPPVLPESDEGVLVVSANVQAFSEDDQLLEQAMAELGADLLITHEKRGARVRGMRRLADNYRADLKKDSHGQAVYCKKDRFCQAEVTQEYGAPGCAMPMALVRFESSFCVVGIHAPPPIPLCAEGLVPYVDEVVSHIEDGRLNEDWGPCKAEDPVLVTGDLNYVPGSRVYRRLLDAGLDDPAAWQGIWAGSWPAGAGWPWLPVLHLDHMLAGDLELDSVRYFSLPDSDHRAVRGRVRPGR